MDFGAGLAIFTDYPGLGRQAAGMAISELLGFPEGKGDFSYAKNLGVIIEEKRLFFD